MSPARRDSLKALPNPYISLDYLSEYRDCLKAKGHSIALTIRLVPDRDILDDESLSAYLEQHLESEERLETLAKHILDDLLNALIPRFLHIELSVEKAGALHRVVMEEKQPKWENSGLLARL